MSCNGCRILRKGCSESCILRPCLQWIDTAEAQAHATVFVAKFFGRAGLMSFISAVPEAQRPALFQSLLFEACGRTMNPVNGAVGLLWTGNWHLCQAAVQTVLRGGALHPIPELFTPLDLDAAASETEVTCAEDIFKLHQDPNLDSSKPKSLKRRQDQAPANLGLSLTPCTKPKVSSSSSSSLFRPITNGGQLNFQYSPRKQRPGTPSMNSEESVTTTCLESFGEPKLLNLFN
uniref:Transcription factor LOB1 n=1 Tax=Diospyros kaki TaxID=35925 RepID=A0A3S8T961_DIOKA|nr:transcription factor LOB1 [Diospyros kaki]